MKRTQESATMIYNLLYTYLTYMTTNQVRKTQHDHSYSNLLKTEERNNWSLFGQC